MKQGDKKASEYLVGLFIVFSLSTILGMYLLYLTCPEAINHISEEPFVYPFFPAGLVVGFIAPFIVLYHIVYNLIRGVIRL